MCDQCAPVGGWTRRSFLTAAGAAMAGGALGPGAPAAAASPSAGGLEVLPRSAWAGDRVPTAAIPDEPDVRFLVVHHTVHRNDYAPDDVVGLLQAVHAFHTGPEKGWPDIAYNFVVDRFGRAWETRHGSLARAVAGDATGGNQGFDQKVAFLGDHTAEAPSPDATATMAALLAALADRSGIDTAPGATATFVSRGSNRHPAGTEVVTATIAGHRAMSYTSCPGEAGFAVVRDELPPAVRAIRSGAPPTSAPTAAPTTPPPAPTAAPDAPPAPASSVTMPPASPGVTVVAAPEAGDDDGAIPFTLPGMAAVGAAAVVIGAVIARRSGRG